MNDGEFPIFLLFKAEEQTAAGGEYAGANLLADVQI